MEREFNLSFDQKVPGRVKVVNNILDQSEVPGSREVCRTGTRFLNPDDGYRCMVQALSLYSRISEILIASPQDSGGDTAACLHLH